MKKLFLFILTMGNLMNAAAFRIEYGNNLTISQPVYENLYIAGGTVTINAPVHGDLIIAGGTILINDTVTNDILLAGGSVTFDGVVGGDIRCAGGNIRISKNVTGDVVITGGTLVIDRNVTIGALLASGGNATINGDIMGEIKGAFGDVVLNGNTLKNVDCRAGKITVNGIVGGTSILAARNIIIGNNAVFNNSVRYWNKQGVLDFKQSLKNGKAVYDPSLHVQRSEWYYLGGTGILWLLWYLGMALLMILIIQYAFSGMMKNAADTVFTHSLKSLGFGFLFFIATPVAAVLAFITLIGVPVGLLLIFGYIMVILLSTVITSVVAANWINNRYNNKWNFMRLCFAALGIFILLKLVSLTPFVGWIAMTLLVCMAFGGLLLNVSLKKPPVTTAAP